MGEWLDRIFDEEGVPQEREPAGGPKLNLRVIQSDTKYREVIETELQDQLADEGRCHVGDCSFEYTSSIGFIVHQYLHLIKEADARTVKATLDKLEMILNPAKTTAGELEQGVLTKEERDAAMEDPRLLAAIAAERGLSIEEKKD